MIPWLALTLVLGAPTPHQQIIAEEFAYGDCPDTIAHCLKDPKRPDPIARRLSKLTARLLERGFEPKVVRAVLRARGAFANPFATLKPELAGRPSKGPADAPLVIVEYAEFRCPHCRALVPALDALVRDGEGVRHVFKHHPMARRGAADSFLLSLAAEAAHRQGRFWPMYAALYAQPEGHDRASLTALAEKVGCDARRFAADLDDPALRERVEADRAEGARFGVAGTPTFVINGRVFDLRFDPEIVRDALNEEAERLEVPRPFPELP
jgi:protein-disulfide isomerase